MKKTKKFRFMIIYYAIFFTFLVQSIKFSHEEMNKLEKENEMLFEQLEENEKQMKKIDELIENYHYSGDCNNSKNFSESLENYLGITLNENQKGKLDNIYHAMCFKYYLDDNSAQFSPSNNTIKDLLVESEGLLFDNIKKTNEEIEISKIGYDASKNDDYVVVSDSYGEIKYYEATDETMKKYIQANEYLRKYVLAMEDSDVFGRQERFEKLKPVFDSIVDTELKTILCDNILEDNVTNSICKTKVNDETKSLIKEKKD